MKNKEPKTKRIQISLKAAKYDLVKKMSENDNVSMSMIINMAFNRGLNSMMTNDPEFMKFAETEREGNL